MNVQNIISVMEKMGSITFESSSERESLTKIAQGMIPPQMPVDPSMMAQQAGMAPMVDPSTAAMPPAGAPIPEAAQGPSIAPAMNAEDAMVGEGITQKDIESLVKIINIVTSLKNKYDAIKAEQMNLIKAQTEGSQDLVPKL